jgi:glycosyltransferase involved in cell wall biosynthesis
MRILFIIESLGFGGAEILLKNISIDLVRLGITSEVAYLFDPKDLSAELELNNIPVHYLNASRRDFLGTGRKIARLVATRSIDIVHAHLFHAALATAVSRCCGNRKPALITFHNRGYDAYPPKTLLQRLRRYLDGLMTRTFFDHWIAVSEDAADSARRHLKLSAVDVIPNGIDLKPIEKAFNCSVEITRAQYSIGQGVRLIVFPGRLVWEKGHKVFLEAWPRIVKYCPDVTGLIVGDGPLRSELEDLIISMHMGETLRILPRLEQFDLYTLLRASDVVAIPSYSEGWPLLVAEVMGLGVPIVCTSAGGIPEVLGDGKNAYIVPIGDSDALAEGVISLLTDAEKCKQMTTAGRLRALNDLSIDVVTKKHMEVYYSAISTGKDSNN